MNEFYGGGWDGGMGCLGLCKHKLVFLSSGEFDLSFRRAHILQNALSIKIIFNECYIPDSGFLA